MYKIHTLFFNVPTWGVVVISSAGRIVKDPENFEA